MSVRTESEQQDAFKQETARHVCLAYRILPAELGLPGPHLSSLDRMRIRVGRRLDRIRAFVKWRRESDDA